ncbi:MAG: SMI1/KNR4 family protein [Blastocatellia bacterium]
MVRKPAERLTLNDLDEVELNRGVKLPDEVRRHYLEYNGGIPDPNCWVMENGEWHCVQQFLPIKYGKRTLESVYLKGVEKGYLGPEMVPFANDQGGNYFCFDQAGRVFFYAMDVWSPDATNEENKKRAAKLLADSFNEFVSGLDVNPVEDEDEDE